MTALLATPTPYLRDGLRRLVAGLRKDAETVRLNLAEAEQDVADARQILAEAEAQHKRAKDAADRLAEEIAFFEREAAERTPPAYDPDAALAATGLMPRDIPAEEHTCANMGCTSCTGCDGCVCHDPAHTCLPWDASTQTECDGCMNAARAEVARADDLTAPGVADSRAQIAPHLPPPVPHDPAGQLVATSGPTVTMPDTGLNPDPLPPASPSAEARHARPARPKGARLTGGFKALISKQDGDETDD